MSAELKIARLILLVLGTWAMIVYFSSCRTKSQLNKSDYNSESVVEKLTERETLEPFVVPGDSSGFVALLKCDSLNNILIAELKEYKTKGIASDLTIQNGRIIYHSKRPDQTAYSINRYITRMVEKKLVHKITITKTVYKPPDIIIKKGFYYYLGLIVCWLFIVCIVVYIVSKFSNLKLFK